MAATAAGATVVVLGPTAIAYLSAPTADDWRWLNVFVLTVAAVLFQSALALGLRYHAFGEAQIGLLAAAMLATAIPHAAVTFSALIAGTPVAPHQVGGPARVGLVLPLCAVGILFLRSRKIDQRLRPMTWGAGAGVLVSAVAIPTTLLRDGEPLNDWIRPASDFVLIIFLAGFAVALSRTRALSARARGYAVAVVCLFLVALATATLVGVTGVEQLLMVSVVAVLAGTALVVVSTLTLLWDAYELDMSRLKSWLERADAAEREQRSLQERLHQVRSSVAALKGGLTALAAQPELPVPERVRFERLLRHEATRLERLLSIRELSAAQEPREVQLDDVIRPVVLAERAQGGAVGWVPGGVTASCDPWATAEILRILLANVRQHAAGASVWITTAVGPETCQVLVADNGPGVDPAIAEELFRRGVRSPSSGGEGIGLVLGRRLAREQGGDLVVVNRGARGGAVFALHLPCDSRAQVPGQRRVQGRIG